ncbi:MAG: nucleotide sugar dehydrogenase [Bacteroidota bacterium]
MATTKEILKKIKNKNVTIGVIGMGYVGLPLALEFAMKEVKTIGFDIDNTKINKLNKGINYNQDLDSALIKQSVNSGFLQGTINFSLLKKCDAVFICVPTPFTENKDPDISFIVNAAVEIAKYLQKDQTIILKSTTFPGTTTKYVQPILESKGKKAGKDFYLAFSPERIDPGNKVWNTKNTPIVVGGVSNKCTKVACAFTSLAVENVKAVSTPEIAEMEKLLENIFRSVNIALVNELAQLCDRIGVNIWEVVDAAATKPFGFMPFYPGPGIGGHCILIDPYYLAWMAREYDFVTNFIQLAAETNEYMPFYVTNLAIREISKQSITLNKAKILLLGMAFKRDVDDLRHSPALKVAELMQKEGFKNITYFDPYIPEIRIGNEVIHSEKNISPAILKKYDLVVITTDHSAFDFDMIVKNSKAVIDTRNACKNVKDKSRIVLLGSGK